MLKLAKILAVLTVILGLTVGTVSASQESLPDSPLYGIKLQVEDLRIGLTRDPASEAVLAMTMAQERVQEAVKLAEGDREIPESVAERYRAQVSTALQRAGEVTGAGERTRLQAGIDQELAVQMRTIESLRVRLQSGECMGDPAPIEKMIQTMAMAQARLGGPPEDPEKGPQGPRAADEDESADVATLSDEPSANDSNGPNEDRPDAGTREAEQYASQGDDASRGNEAYRNQGETSAEPYGPNAECAEDGDCGGESSGPGAGAGGSGGDDDDDGGQVQLRKQDRDDSGSPSANGGNGNNGGETANGGGDHNGGSDSGGGDHDGGSGNGGGNH
jgi:uncharacterized membrane protein YgcG